MQVKGIIAASAAVLVIAACGTSEPEPTQRTLTITSSSPINNQDGVKIDKTVSITFREALDQTTVTASNILLMPGSAMMHMSGMEDMDMEGVTGEMDHTGVVDTMADSAGAITGQVSCDASCTTITFQPHMHLDPGTMYHIMLHGVRSKAGGTFTGTHVVPLQFTTMYNLRVKRDVYKNNQVDQVRNFDWNKDAVPPKLKQEVRTYNSEAGVQRYTVYNQLLPGGRTVSAYYDKGQYVFGNPASGLRYYRFDMTEGGKVVAHVTFNGPGQNGTWGDGDDTVSSWSDHNHDHGAHRVIRTYRTTSTSETWSSYDQMASNANFKLRRASLAIYDNNERIMKTVRFSDLGPDNMPNVDASGNPTANSNDTVTEYRIYEYDPTHGRRIARREYDAPEGGSLTFNPNNDVLSGYRAYKNIGMHRAIEVTYTGAGNDGQFLDDPSTPGVNEEDDNTIRDYEVEYYCNNARAFQLEINPGADGRIGNFQNISALMSAAENSIMNYCNPSPPSMPLSGDDFLKEIDFYESTAN